MKHWEIPPRIKIHEALGAIADDRLEMVSGEEGRLRSSRGDKEYVIKYDPETNAIMMNDNGAYWKGYLGYTGIALLMRVGALSFDKKMADSLRGIAWKDINTKNKNDWDRTLLEVKDIVEDRGVAWADMEAFVDSVMVEIIKKNFIHLGRKMKPAATSI